MYKIVFIGDYHQLIPTHSTYILNSSLKREVHYEYLNSMFIVFIRSLPHVSIGSFFLEWLFTECLY